MLQFKHGVDPVGASVPLTLAIVGLNDIFNHYKVDLMITSIMDGTHSSKSYHRFGMAFDFRTNSIPQETLDGIKTTFERNLGWGGWQLVYEDDHGHVEFDP